MAGSTSFGRKPAGGPAAYRALPRLPQPPGVNGFARLPSLDGRPEPANDAGDWRRESLPVIPPANDHEDRFVDELDIETWKAQRRGRKPALPWRQISLMAGLSFGVGSFVLPADVNEFVRPGLWALSALAFVSSFAPGRRQK